MILLKTLLHLASFYFLEGIAEHAIAQSSVRVQAHHLLPGETASVLSRLLEALQSLVIVSLNLKLFHLKARHHLP
jgi:hypothetical protein